MLFNSLPIIATYDGSCVCHQADHADMPVHVYHQLQVACQETSTQNGNVTSHFEMYTPPNVNLISFQLCYVMRAANDEISIF